MQYSAEHENDGQLAAAIVMSSQAMTIALVCCFAVVAPHIATIDRAVFSGALLAASTAVALASAVGVKALAPSKMDSAKNRGAVAAPSACMRTSSSSSRATRVARRREAVREGKRLALAARQSSFATARRAFPQTRAAHARRPASSARAASIGALTSSLAMR